MDVATGWRWLTGVRAGRPAGGELGERPGEAPGEGPEHTMVFRPGLTRVFTVVWAVIAVWFAVDAALHGSARSIWLTLTILALMSVVVVALFWRPAVVVDDQAVTLRNVIRDITVPWNRLDDVRTQWALTLVVGGRQFTAWAAPAPGRSAHRRLTRERTDVMFGPGAVAAASETAAGDSGAAAFLVRQRWESRRASVAGDVRARLVLPVVLPLLASVTLLAAVLVAEGL